MGSTFHFLAEFSLAARGTKEDQSQSPGRLRGARVLVVDDNATSRRILRDMLTQWGMEVATAESGPAALDILHQAARNGISFPLIIADGQMPGMDGFALTENIRAAREISAGRIMILTSADQTNAPGRCQELEISEYILKPVAPGELLPILLTMLDERTGEHAVTQPRSLAAPAAKGRALNILLAEDNVFNQKVAVGMLEMSGHTVTVANNGQEAVAAWMKHSFDLVLMDIQMPEMDGVEATGLIRRHQHENGMRAPIIAMTAYAMAGDREKYIAAGMDDYISKPINRDDLETVVRRNVADTGGNVGPVSAERSPQKGIDKQDMLQRFGGNRDLLRTATNIFPEEAAKVLAALERSRSGGSPKGVELHAHTLKGLCAMFEAAAAAKVALELEKAARSGDLGTDAQVSALREELARAGGGRAATAGIAGKTVETQLATSKGRRT